MKVPFSFSLCNDDQVFYQRTIKSKETHHCELQYRLIFFLKEKK